MDGDKRKRLNEDKQARLDVKRIAVEDEVPAFKVNEFYLKKNFMKALAHAFSRESSMEFGNGGRFIALPFRCCLLPDFLCPEEPLEDLREELTELDVVDKENDLFQFKQSADLKDVRSPNIETFKKIIYKPLLEWMKTITGIPLNGDVDMTFSSYSQTDVLLCHDDELEGRRIAFIYYMSSNWLEGDGGSLDLFSSEAGKPTDISTSFLPLWNNFIFFEVSPLSFHQVSEILSNKSRLSVSGWYYGPPIKAAKPVYEPCLLFSPYNYEGNIREWINPIYFQPGMQLQIRKTFGRNSEIEIPDFLQQNKYDEVAQALLDCRKESWKYVGPQNLRYYEELTIIPPIVRECFNVLHSEAMCLVLSNISGLKLHPIAAIDSNSSSCSSDSNSDTEFELETLDWDAEIATAGIAMLPESIDETSDEGIVESMTDELSYEAESVDTSANETTDDETAIDSMKDSEILVEQVREDSKDSDVPKEIEKKYEMTDEVITGDVPSSIIESEVDMKMASKTKDNENISKQKKDEFEIPSSSFSTTADIDGKTQMIAELQSLSEVEKVSPEVTDDTEIIAEPIVGITATTSSSQISSTASTSTAQVHSKGQNGSRPKTEKVYRGRFKTALHADAKSSAGRDASNVRIRTSIRRWTHRYYTLLRENSEHSRSLDATLFFNCEGWRSTYGGCSIYCDDQDELLRVEPRSNCLALVYLDEHTDRFVKYVNCSRVSMIKPFFHDMFFTYFK